LSIEIKRYYDSEEEFCQFYKNLKQTMCPFCKFIGALILWGYLRGNDEDSPNKKVVRGRRVFCNNRKKRNNGCGHTFSVLAANTLKNFCITAESLWRFLKDNVTLRSKPEEPVKIKDFPLTKFSAYRLLKKFSESQSKLRSWLTRICQVPKLPKTTQAAIQTIEHLKAAFSESTCPISAFQDHFQRSFI
jgi:hypothetical protein